MKRENTGMILFGLIAAVVLACAIVAFQAAGPLGIEERFSSAAGGSSPKERGNDGGGIAGLSVEGNVLLYLLVVAALAIACVFIYWKYRS